MQARARYLVALALLTSVLSACGSSSDAGSDASGTYDAEKTFSGRTVKVIVTNSPGGGTDLFGRYVASKLGDAIPGQPRVTVTNVEDLAGLTNVYEAPGDDLVVGVSSGASGLYTALLDPASTIDVTKVRFIGASTASPDTITLFTDAMDAYGADFSSAENATEPTMKWAMTVGGVDDVFDSPFFAAWLCDTLEAPCSMVSVADDDSAALGLMVQRGEINTRTSSLITAVRDYDEQLRDGSAAIPFVYGTRPDEHEQIVLGEGNDVPDLVEVLPSDAMEEYETILPVIGKGGFDKNFWVGPETSDDVLQTLRDAFDEVVGNPENLEELQAIMSGDLTAGNDSFVPNVMSGVDAQAAYEVSSTTFRDNLEYYRELQEEFFARYYS